LLWDAYHLGGVSISLSYSVVGRGLPRRPDPETDEIDPDEEPATISEAVSSGAIPVLVDPEGCDSCFESHELDAEIPAGYTFLDVYCYDFETGEAPTDLARVLVDIRGRAITGDKPVERLRFVPGGSVRDAVHFKFAVDLDAGYEFRVVRLFADGHSEVGDGSAAEDAWARVEQWAGILDVTRYTELAATKGPLDPRMLY